MNTENVQFTAGLAGFVVLFVVGLVIWALGRDMNRRLRRMRFREEQAGGSAVDREGRGDVVTDESSDSR